MAGYNRLTPGGAVSASANNANVDALELLHYSLGRGIIYGLEVTHVSGLTVQVAAGALVTLKAASLAVRNVVLPDDSTVYLWIDNEGDVTTTTTLSYPGGNVVRLDRVTTAGGSVISIEPESRIYVPRVDVNGVYTIGDLLTVDLVNRNVSLGAGSSLSLSGGAPLAVSSIRRGHNQETLTGDLTLTAASPRIQRLTASGANRKVILPDPSTLTFGDEPFRIHNDGASNNLLIRDHTDTTTLATLTPGQSASTSFSAVGGDPGWGPMFSPSGPPD